MRKRSVDKTQFVLSTVQPMAQYTLPYVVSIIGVHSPSEGRHVGSGVRCILDGRRAIVTARHVIQEATSYPGGFALSAGYGASPYQVHGAVRCDWAADLAVYFLPDDYKAPNESVAFWSDERIDRACDRVATDYLFVHGFPGRRSRFSAFGPGVVSSSLPYGVMQKLEVLPSDLQEYHFALDFAPANMKVISQGASADTDPPIDPHGLSGSPVWRIGASGRSTAEWTPELSVLVGIITQWRPREQVLVATYVRRILRLAETS